LNENKTNSTGLTECGGRAMGEVSEQKKSLHPSIKRHAVAMQKKLDANKHKDTESTDGWLLPSCRLSYLINSLDEEVMELKQAIYNHPTGDAVRMEAADVANMAMMIADRAEKNLEDYLK